MIGAPNTRGQKYWAGIVQWAPETSVLEEITDIFRNHNIDEGFHSYFLFDVTIFSYFVSVNVVNEVCHNHTNCIIAAKTI